MFDNGYEFKKDCIPLLKYLPILPVCTTIKNSQDRSMLELVKQVIDNILVNKGLDENLFDYINPWGETLSSIL